MRCCAIWLCILLGIASMQAAIAGTTNEVPSCYAANKLDIKLPLPDRELFVLVDQTTLFDEKLQNSIFENTWSFLGANSAFTIVAFSAFAQGRYTDVVASGMIEPPFPEKERNSTSQKLLKSFAVSSKPLIPFSLENNSPSMKLFTNSIVTHKNPSSNRWQ